MRRLVLLATLLLPLAASANAAEVDFTIRQDLYNNEHLDSGQSVSVKLKNNKGYYIHAGYAKTSYKYGSQQLANMDIFSAGVGIQKEIFDGISLYTQIGYYHPVPSALHKFSSYEAMEYLATDRIGMNKHEFDAWGYNPYRWKHREFSADGDVGGELGLSMQHNLTDALTASLTAAYRYVNITHHVKMWDEKIINTGAYWGFGESIDYSGVSLELSLSYNF